MTMASGRLVYATTTGTLSAIDFTGGPSGTATVLSGPPSTASPGSPGGCSSSTSPPDSLRAPARTTRCGPDPFRYPAPRRPL
jgi:hypothetical protein